MHIISTGNQDITNILMGHVVKATAYRCNHFFEFLLIFLLEINP